MIFFSFFFSFSDQETLKLVDSTVQIVKMGKIPGSSVQIPFKIPLKSDSDLVETYHGVDISIEYSMKGEIKRGLLSQNIQTPLMGKGHFFKVSLDESIKSKILHISVRLFVLL